MNKQHSRRSPESLDFSQGIDPEDQAAFDEMHPLIAAETAKLEQEKLMANEQRSPTTAAVKETPSKSKKPKKSEATLLEKPLSAASTTRRRTREQDISFTAGPTTAVPERPWVRQSDVEKVDAMPSETEKKPVKKTAKKQRASHETPASTQPETTKASSRDYSFSMNFDATFRDNLDLLCTAYSLTRANAIKMAVNFVLREDIARGFIKVGKR